MALGPAEDAALSRLWRLLPQMGLAVQANHPEDGPGQFEINLAPHRALASADAAFTFRNAVKEIVARAGLRVTFMAKPFAEFSGNGFHLHQSLRDAVSGQPLFSSPDDRGRPSDACGHFVAGQIAFAGEAAALFLPTVNSYKRTELRGPKPLSVCWDGDNRTVALRLLANDETGVRLENRIAGADANPYLLMAAALATGAAGRAQGLRLPAPLCGDAYAAEERAEALPASLQDALALLDRSEILRSALGDGLVDLFVALKRSEAERFRRSVTDWEVREYSTYI
jgi:glutamine synthetase